MQQAAISIHPWAQLLLAFVPALGAVFAAVALCLNFKQSRRTNAQGRATLVAGMLERFMEDGDMRAIFYSIEYSRFMYDQIDFHGSEKERQLDKLLMHFSRAALAWRAGLLDQKDLQPLQYFVRRILRDEHVKKYLAFVSEWGSKAALGEHPYVALSEMGKKLGA